MPNPEDKVWDRILELWNVWKMKPGEDYFRLGAPSLVAIEATFRPSVQPPA